MWLTVTLEKAKELKENGWELDTYFDWVDDKWYHEWEWIQRSWATNRNVVWPAPTAQEVYNELKDKTILDDVLREGYGWDLATYLSDKRLDENK